MALKVKRFERLVSICLDGAALADMQENNAKLITLARQIKGAEGDEARTAELTALIDAATDAGREASARAQAETVVFRLRAMPGHVWDSLGDEHPAKDDESLTPVDSHRALLDAALSYVNAEHPEWTCFVEAKRADGTVEPFTGADWAELAADLASEQIFDFHEAVLTLNAGSNSVPFLPPASKPSPPSDEK